MNDKNFLSGINIFLIIVVLLLIGTLSFQYKDKILNLINVDKTDDQTNLQQRLEMVETGLNLKDELLKKEQEKEENISFDINKIKENIKEQEQNTTQQEDKKVKSNEDLEMLNKNITNLNNKIKQLEKENKLLNKDIKNSFSQVIKNKKEVKQVKENISLLNQKFYEDKEKLNKNIDDLKKEDERIVQELVNVTNFKVENTMNNLQKVEKTVEIIHKEVFSNKPFVIKSIIEDQMAIISNGKTKIKLFKNNETEIDKIKYLVTRIGTDCVELEIIKSQRMETICK